VQISPHKFLLRARKQLRKYTTVASVKTTVDKVIREGGFFVVHDRKRRIWKSKAVLLATGLVDHLPVIPNIEKYYGISVHHCPYCDGWESRGEVLGVIGSDEAATQLALELCLWSRRVILFTNLPAVGAKTPELPAHAEIRLVTGKVGGLQSVNGVENQLEAVSMEDGERIACHALFFSPHQAQHSSLAQRLGCQVDGSSVGCDSDGCTDVPGLFVAGNVTKGIQMAIVAAAESLVTAAAINNWLMDLDASSAIAQNQPQSPVAANLK
jgi:thioredoxin reductase